VIIVTPNHYDDRLYFEPRVEDGHTIHGDHALPDGYRWVIPPPSTSFTLVEGLKGRGETKISRSRSLLKMAISVVQLVLSSFTIYRTRGPQIERYGYASFGLSTIPYAFMSLFNLICVGCTGEYPYLFMLRTRTLEEASRRAGAQISGAVGILADNASQSESGQSGDGTRECENLLPMEDMRDGITFVSLWRENGGTLLCAKIGNSTKRFKLVDNAEDAAFIFDVQSSGNRLCIYEPKEKEYESDESDESLPQSSWLGRSLLLSLARRRLKEPSFIFKISIALALPVLALFLPYVVISVLTKFQKQQSTAFQRVAMMSWLAMGQFFSMFTTELFDNSPNYIIPSPRRGWRFAQKLKKLYQNSDHLESDPSMRNSNLWWKVVFFLAVFIPFESVVLFGPPFAGFVVVGKMLYEFDTCSLK